jgi:hypothetical protein
LYRMLQPLDEPIAPISGQAYVQYPGIPPIFNGVRL